MDRFQLEEWKFECNQGEKIIKSNLSIYNNSFLSLQNQRAGISYEFHTYEALNLIPFENQNNCLYREGTITGDHTRFCKDPQENSSFSSYIGRIKLSYRHGSINIEQSDQEIDIERLKKNDPILWFTEINFFSKNTVLEKADLTVKVRVMPEFFFCLSRTTSFLSRKIVRSMETRVFHEYGSDHMLRVFSLKENSPEELSSKCVQLRFEGSKLSEEVIQSLDKRVEISDKIFI